jgi:hypothetical protein
MIGIGLSTPLINCLAFTQSWPLKSLAIIGYNIDTKSFISIHDNYFYSANTWNVFLRDNSHTLPLKVNLKMQISWEEKALFLNSGIVKYLKKKEKNHQGGTIV